MQNIYDNQIFFEEYQKMRSKEINANNLIEKPILRDLLPNLNGKRVLDLGCGAGELSSYCMENGAESVMGLDISTNMIAVAKETYPNISFHKVAMENLNTIQSKFNLVVSSLAFHYVENFDKLISDVKNCLEPNGELVFSQEHPIATAFIPVNKHTDKRTVIDGKTYYLISDYNNIGRRSVHWNIDGVIKYHRNFSEVINTLARHGFKIEEIIESYASEDVIKKEPKYKYQNDRPYFLFIKCKLGD